MSSGSVVQLHPVINNEDQTAEVSPLNADKQPTLLDWITNHWASLLWATTLAVFLLNALVFLWPSPPVQLSLSPIEAPVSLTLSSAFDDISLDEQGSPTIDETSSGFKITGLKHASKQHSSSKKTLKPVNINTATYNQLQQLPNVGPKMASKIIALRKKLGQFTSVEQLLEVPGIGPKKLAKMKPYCLL